MFFLTTRLHLREILLYHVAGERLTANDVVELTNITTLEGSELPVSVTDEGVFVGNAQIIVQDINASNGVIHVIDTGTYSSGSASRTKGYCRYGN